MQTVGRGSVRVTTHYHRYGACTMTTTVKTTAADTILAIDLGKYKSTACVYRSANDQRVQHTPRRGIATGSCRPCDGMTSPYRVRTGEQGARLGRVASGGALAQGLAFRGME